MSIIARLLAALRNRKTPPQPQRALPYRATPDDGEAAVRDMEAHLAGLRLRVRALEHQLEVRGEEPTLTPAGRDLLDLADFLDRYSRCQSLERWDTVEIRVFAKLVRGLARYHR